MIVDIYTRQSGAETEASPELQEAACRAYAEAQGWEVDEVVYEPETSSQLAADERGLGDLVRKCERGDSDGIVCRHIDRFGRNVGEGARAYKRIQESGARLVAVADGLDSSRDGSKPQFTMLMLFAEQTYDRNRAYYISGKERKVAQGVWCATTPFGYDRDEDGRLVKNDDAETVRLIFKLRAEGQRFSEIAARDEVRVTRSGVRKVVMNRAYLGEQRIPDDKNPGQGKVATSYPGHPPLVTEAEWQAANAVKTGRAPVHTGLKDAVELKGIVRCGLCDAKLTVAAYGKGKTTYACTNGCGKVGMATHLVEPPVLAELETALEDGEPHVAAVLQGDTRYADALAGVEQAQRDLEEYRDSLDIQRELGPKTFADGLRVRKEMILEARRALRETPRPFEQTMTREEFMALDAKLYYPRLIAEVRVYPRTAEHRLTMRWQGAEDAFPVVTKPATVNIAELLAAERVGAAA